MVAEHRLGDQVVHELLRRVLVHRDLLEHDLALGVELRERRREHHVAHHVERRLEVVVGDARVDERVLARRGGVQLAAEAVEDLRDLERAVPVGALEQQVLDEVRDARLARRLVARAGADPVADRDRADVVETLGDHPLAGVELGQRPVLHAAGWYSAPTTGVVGQQRPEQSVRPPPVEPDRAALAPLLLEAGALREPLGGDVVGMRAHLEPPYSLREQPVADEPHGASHVAAPASGRARQVRELIVVAVPPRRDDATDGRVVIVGVTTRSKRSPLAAPSRNAAAHRARRCGERRPLRPRRDTHR